MNCQDPALTVLSVLSLFHVSVCFVFEHMALSLLLSAMCSSCPASLLLVATPPCLVLICLSVVTCPSCLWSCLSECCHLFLMFSCPFILFSLSLLFCYVSVCLRCLTSLVIPLIPYLVVCRFCLSSCLVLSCPVQQIGRPVPSLGLPRC